MLNKKNYFLAILFGLLLIGAAACQAADETLPPTPPITKPDQAYPAPTVTPDEPVAYPEPDPEIPMNELEPCPEPDNEPVSVTYLPDLNPQYAPQAVDAQYQCGLAFIASTDLLLLESFPVQVQLQLLGDLPTPCHELRVLVAAPDDQNRIQIEAYSVVDPGLICIQVTESFDAVISLGSFTEGIFTLWLNGEQIDEFTLP